MLHQNEHRRNLVGEPKTGKSAYCHLVSLSKAKLITTDRHFLIYLHVGVRSRSQPFASKRDDVCATWDLVEEMWVRYI